MHRWLALASVLLGLGAGLGCFSPTDPLGRQDALKETQERYTEYVRWGELEKAGTFVDPELREDFLDLAKDYEALRITDFEIAEIRYDDHDGASVIVTYEGYLQTTLVERTAREEQEWYREEGMRNVWRVRPQLGAVLAALRGVPPGPEN